MIQPTPSMPTRSTPAPWLRRLVIVVFFAVLAWVQLDLVVANKPDGAWFLFGRDTVSHDAPVQMWMAREVLRSGELPLWMPPLHGGLPTLGAWLWTPLAPSIWAHEVLPFPLAQRFQFLWALWWAGLGGYVLGRVTGLSRGAAMIVGIGAGLSGHVVTLIHAGHLQKILALAWLPWLAAGGWGVLGGRHDRSPWQIHARWTALAGFSLGMMFLSGHPQIAYVGAHVLLVMALLGGGLIWLAMKRRLGILVIMLAIGGLVGSAQLIPGLEMSALSNRGGGVALDEAAATSYPPAELGEFALPRHRGDSSPAGRGEYLGAWGERLVSDYAGALIIVLAVIGLARRHGRRREKRAPARLVWGVVLAVSILVGLGSYTPLYGLLHTVWPGMASFRSPGTFFAGAALALPILAGLGADALPALAKRLHGSALLIALVVFAGLVGAGLLVVATGSSGVLVSSLARTLGIVLIGAAAVAGSFLYSRSSLPALMIVSAITIGDLAFANRAFLLAAEWQPYEAYLSPTAVDVALMDEPRPLRVYEPGRELSLQSLLNDRDALLGYHPVTYRAVEEQTQRLGFDSREWRAAWGVQHRILPTQEPLLPGEAIVAELPGALLVRDDSIRGPVRGSAGVEVTEWEWLERMPNRVQLRVVMETPWTVLVKETAAPGWRMRVGEGPWQPLTDVEPLRRVGVPEGETIVTWEYRPQSYRVGLFLTMIGLLLSSLGAGLAVGSRSAELEAGREYPAQKD